MIIIHIIYNLAVLVSVSVMSGFIDKRWSRATLHGKILQGLIFGSTAIIAMLNPFELAPGIIFDGRSVVLSLCAFFFGPVTGLIAGILAVIVRLIIGGHGALMGVSVILSSVIIGLIFHGSRTITKSPISIKKLYFLGIVVHIAMLGLMMALPVNFVWFTFQTIAITVIVSYPLATVLIGKILIDQEDNSRLISELSESEENLSITLNSIGDGVISTDDIGRIVQMNPVAEKLCGWTLPQAQGHHLSEVFCLLNAITREPVTDPVELVIRTHEVIGLANHTVLVSKDGSEYQISDSAAPIIDKSGKVTGVVLVFSDITEEYSTHQALRESEEIFRCFMEYSPIYIFFKDENIRSLRLSSNYELMLGKPMSEILGKTMYDLFPSELAKKMVEDDKQVLNEGKLVAIQEELNGKTYSTMKFPVYVEGKPRFLAGYTIDITEQKQVEEDLRKAKEAAENANSEKDKFFSIIAHDLKSPFSGFLGLTKLIAENIENITMTEMKELGGNLHDSAANLFALLENLLEWSRIQRGVIKFLPENNNITFIIDNNIQIIHETAKQKDLSIVNTIKDELVVFSDIAMINAVLRNLLSNAIKFTPKGGQIEIGSSSDPMTSDNCIYVKDTGIGMDKDLMSKLFKIDQKVSRPGTEGESSTGLGLLLCKEFIEKHGGRIWVESAEGFGSTFYFTLKNFDQES